MYPYPLFEIFGRGVYLYGICVAVGIIACFALLMFTMSRLKFNDYSSNVIVIVGLLSTGLGFLFSLLFQALYNYIENPSAGFVFGDLTFLGGLLGGVVCFIGIYCLFIYVIHPKNTVKFLSGDMNATLSDALPFIPIGIVLAHAFGRLGCFFAGCCYGLPTDAWYGLPCAAGYSGNVIPTQLFEMIFLFILAAVMALLFYKFKFNYNFSVYMISYGIFRFIIEFWRNDQRGQFLGSTLSPSQIWSIVLVILGIAYVFLQNKFFAKNMKHPELAKAAETAETDGTEADSLGQSDGIVEKDTETAQPDVTADAEQTEPETQKNDRDTYCDFDD